MTTRIDASKRMELLKNRINYLAEKITDYQSEITVLTREHELLDGIMRLYQENECDPIDEGRKAIFEREIFEREETKKGGRNRGASDEIFSLLQEQPMTTKEILTKTGYPNITVYNTTAYLRMGGRIKLGNDKKWRVCDETDRR